MRRGAGAAPPRPRYVGVATIVLSGLCVLGLATSRALAGSPLEVPTDPTTTTTATIAAAPPPPPAPDPKPDPKPDPQPPRPKQRVRPKPPPPPPPPPPPVEPAERRAVATTATPPAAPPETRAKPTVRSKTPAKVAATGPRPRPAGSLRRVPVRRAKVVRRTPPAPARRAFALEPAPLIARAEPSLPIAVPAILPLLGLGLLLLLGASVASARWVPWPEVAEPLYARRHDIAIAGCGAIAVALLWLNAAVLF
jgi:hypothetical protein